VTGIAQYLVYVRETISIIIVTTTTTTVFRSQGDNDNGHAVIRQRAVSGGVHQSHMVH
jgi:hypothetical protein